MEVRDMVILECLVMCDPEIVLGIRTHSVRLKHGGAVAVAEPVVVTLDFARGHSDPITGPPSRANRDDERNVRAAEESHDDRGAKQSERQSP